MRARARAVKGVGARLWIIAGMCYGCARALLSAPFSRTQRMAARARAWSRRTAERTRGCARIAALSRLAARACLVKGKTAAAAGRALFARKAGGRLARALPDVGGDTGTLRSETGGYAGAYVGWWLCSRRISILIVLQATWADGKLSLLVSCFALMVAYRSGRT